MSRRLSYSEKGKGPSEPPRTARVKVPPFDNSKLLKQHSLTLMGRLTNPKIQRMWNLIPFFTEHWKGSANPIGADLGRDLFQFQFSTEKDLQNVLDNRPYHFAYWMIIVERWEPTTLSSFPLQIPFWIRVQGIPLHMCSEETMLSIANDIGHYEGSVITATSAKMKVQVDGLKPLIMSSMVEFENGDEVEATLVYEKLEKHCTSCYRLDHDAKDCSLTEPLAPEEVPIRAQKHTTQRDEPYQRYYEGKGKGKVRERGRYDRQDSDRRYLTTGSLPGTEGTLATNLTKIRGPEQTYPRWIEKGRPALHDRTSESHDPTIREIARQRRPPLDKERTPERSPERLPRDALNSALGEIREVMVQYSSCADPSESAAHKERLRQAEETGQLEESAAQMVRASLASQAAATVLSRALASPEALSHDRIPASQRLGPTFLTTGDIIEIENANQDSNLGKRKRGRPVGRKTAIKTNTLLQGTSSRKRKVYAAGSPRKRGSSASPKALRSISYPPPSKSTGGRQRVGNPWTEHRLKELKKRLDPDVIFLSETKNPDVVVLSKVESLGYHSHAFVSPHGIAGGGLALIWKPNIQLDVIFSCINYFDTRISFEGKNFYATFVYGDPDRATRKRMWKHLNTLNQIREAPWFLTGDFNDIIDNSEKEGGVIRAEGTFGDFRTFLSEGDLFDLRHSGNFLSWRGKRNDHLVHCRLDKSLSNSEWAEMFPSGRCEYLRFEGSDHRPVVSYFDPNRLKQKGMFRYDRRLKDNEEVTSLIAKVWEESSGANLNQKIIQCRKAIVIWSKNQQLNSQKCIEKLKAGIEVEMSSSSPNEVLLTQLNEELRKAYAAEEAFWKQRSRQQWLQLGDHNTSYFHAATRARFAVNKFSVVEDETGITVYEEDQMIQVISDYFQHLFTAQPVMEDQRRSVIDLALNPLVSDADNRELIKDPSPDEIKEALFAIHPDKAPGPDGFSSSFFQTNWSTVGKDIVAEVQAFFISGIMPRSSNSTHIRLIPKILGPKRVADYRPIALCNSVTRSSLN
ncbi:unnamed protein product [Microthlaspi erraticum]|uniref:DUF4283 domain-containing protein n=1 Tax=Microthlaspi erraticum TaxID=1685480 RepID=A0A6D2L3B2_9BRAS|nr:unnamed protein product [Microthlaspi erraticum]